MNKIFVSVIIPAYKESKRIGSTLVSLNNYFKNKSYTYEIIVVNDGSPDNLSEVISEYKRKVDNLKLVSYQKNQGKGYAVKTGMLEAVGEYRLFMDADNSVDISHLDKFLENCGNGTGKSDVVIGSIELLEEGSVKKENNGFLRNFLGKLSKKPVELLATPGIKDTQRGFKLFTKRAAEAVFSKTTIFRFAFDIEALVIARKNNYQIKELPVVFNNPVGSTVSLFSYVDSLKDLAIITFRKLLGKYDIIKKPSVVTPVLLNLIIFGGITFVATGAIFPSEIFGGTVYADGVSEVYARQQFSKNQFGEMLTLGIILVSLGIDFVGGFVVAPALKQIKVLSRGRSRNFMNSIEGENTIPYTLD